MRSDQCWNWGDERWAMLRGLHHGCIETGLGETDPSAEALQEGCLLWASPGFVWGHSAFSFLRAKYTAQLLPSHVLSGSLFSSPLLSFFYLTVWSLRRAGGNEWEECVSPQLPISGGQWVWLKGSSLLDFTHHINHIDQPPERQHIVWE